MKYAITGGIGSGKSYVCRMLKDYGIEVYDCDAAAKRLMRTDRTLQQRLSDAVGAEVFPDGQLNKAVLAKFLLASEENNRIINNIVHPAVADDFASSGMSWLESAILFEADFQKYVDRVVCVSAPLEVRTQRIMKRDGISREQATEWIDRQMPQEEKERRSHYVIENDGVTSLEKQIEKMLADIQATEAHAAEVSGRE